MIRRPTRVRPDAVRLFERGEELVAEGGIAAQLESIPFIGWNAFDRRGEGNGHELISDALFSDARFSDARFSDARFSESGGSALLRIEQIQVFVCIECGHAAGAR